MGFLGGQRADRHYQRIKRKSNGIPFTSELIGWVEDSIGMKLQGIDMFPVEVEFGKLNDSVYAEIL
ncbi:hypothetical protein [Peribacillus simplex]|uniref:hypothetical protein n=1 Tax=Peribacillus simplex TaxID=1478 RepID=UPI0036DD54E2